MNEAGTNEQNVVCQKSHRGGKNVAEAGKIIVLVVARAFRCVERRIERNTYVHRVSRPCGKKFEEGRRTCAPINDAKTLASYRTIARVGRATIDTRLQMLNQIDRFEYPAYLRHRYFEFAYINMGSLQ